jgi:hypothetical protein
VPGDSHATSSPETARALSEARNTATNALIESIVFTCDRGPLAGEHAPFDPIVDVEIELPYPITKPDFDYGKGPLDLALPFATQRIRLDGPVDVGGSLITWKTTREVTHFLQSARAHLFGEGRKAPFAAQENVLRILTRLRLRSQEPYRHGAPDFRPGDEAGIVKYVGMLHHRRQLDHEALRQNTDGCAVFVFEPSENRSRVGSTSAANIRSSRSL